MEEYFNLDSGLTHRVYWISKRICQGQFVTKARAEVLRRQGVTDILNVGEAPSLFVASEAGFSSIVDIPIEDLHRIPTDIAQSATDSLHQILMKRESRVFVHCIAGQNRSPTILWLYFVACGMTEENARLLIGSKNPDSIPGHPQLIDQELVEHIKLVGSQSYQPLQDKTITEPAY